MGGGADISDFHLSRDGRMSLLIPTFVCRSVIEALKLDSY